MINQVWLSFSCLNKKRQNKNAFIFGFFYIYIIVVTSTYLHMVEKWNV